MYKKHLLISLAGLFTLFAAGCGSDIKPAAVTKPSESVSTEPVTLRVKSPLSNVEFQQLLVEPVKKKFPNITLEAVDNKAKYEDLIAANAVPDLVNEWNGAVPTLKAYDLLYDITELVKSHNVDLSRFGEFQIDAARSANKKELYGLPYDVNFNALWYNKDIFDRLGVTYPTDGLTWDDAYELAKKVTRLDGNVQYKGLNFHGLYRLAFPMSLSYVDSKTEKANLMNDSRWKTAFEMGKKINSIPGNEMVGDAYNSFLKDKNTAMFATVSLFRQNLEEAAKNGLNWDVAQYPSYKEKPNIYSYIDEQVLMITKTSKHKDEAMEVLKILTSDEVQLQFVKLGRVSPLKSPEMQKAFASELPYVQGKHLEGIFKSSPAPAPVPSVYYANAKKLTDDVFNEYLQDKIDVNTALSKADELINRYIDSVKSK